MKFPRTSRHHSCLICGTEKSKCGWKADNPDFLFCMSIHDAINAPPGWKYIGDTRNGQWGMFIPDTEREYTQEERAEYFQRQQQIKLNQRSTHAKSLTESERHYQHGKLIENLTLHSHHREDLKRRGLSEELIAKGKFRSIDKFQKLDFEVSHNLAGVDISGKSLTNHRRGTWFQFGTSKSKLLATKFVMMRTVTTHPNIFGQRVSQTFDALKVHPRTSKMANSP